MNGHLDDRNREQDRLRSERQGANPAPGAGTPRTDPLTGERRIEPSEPSPGRERSVGDLVGELGREATALIRKEVELARAEMNEKLAVAQRNLVSIGIGAALLFAAVVLLATAANWALTALLTNWVGAETAVWLAPLILTVIVAAVGYALLKKGTNRLKEESVTPHRTVSSLKDDMRWAERKVK